MAHQLILGQALKAVKVPIHLGGLLGTGLSQRPSGGNLSCGNFRLVVGDGRAITAGSAQRDVHARDRPLNPAPSTGFCSVTSAPRREGWLASGLALLWVVPALLHPHTDLGAQRGGKESLALLRNREPQPIPLTPLLLPHPHPRFCSLGCHDSRALGTEPECGSMCAQGGWPLCFTRGPPASWCRVGWGGGWVFG